MYSGQMRLSCYVIRGVCHIVIVSCVYQCRLCGCTGNNTISYCPHIAVLISNYSRGVVPRSDVFKEKSKEIIG